MLGDLVNAHQPRFVCVAVRLVGTAAKCCVLQERAAVPARHDSRWTQAWVCRTKQERGRRGPPLRIRYALASAVQRKSVTPLGV